MLKGSCRVVANPTDMIISKTVCVRPQFVQKCVCDLKGTDVKVASVIGFHEGTYDLYHKAQYVDTPTLTFQIDQLTLRFQEKPNNRYMQALLSSMSYSTIQN